MQNYNPKPQISNPVINKEYYEEKITRVRESKDEELNQYLIISTNHIKREYQTALEGTKSIYKEHILQMKQECQNLKETLQSRDIFINHLCSLISDMELSMTKTRILKSKVSINKYKRNDKDRPIKLDENFYLEQIYNLSLQLDSVKETCKLYQKEIDGLHLKAKNSRDVLAKVENGYKVEIEKLNEQLNHKDLELEMQCKHFRKE